MIYSSTTRDRKCMLTFVQKNLLLYEIIWASMRLSIFRQRIEWNKFNSVGKPATIWIEMCPHFNISYTFHERWKKQHELTNFLLNILYFFFFSETANNHICESFIMHFIGISATNISFGRQYQFVHIENTKFTTNIYTAFQWTTTWCCRSPRFIQSN